MSIIFLNLTSIGLSDEYAIAKVLYEWIIYAALSFVPILVILGLGRQKFITVGVTWNNMKLSVAVGFVLSVLWLGVSTIHERFLNRFFTLNTLYALLYYLLVGFGEELLFRGFLQIRCIAWLGTAKGLVVASAIMAFAHIPQRIFIAGLDPVQTMISATFLIPVTLFLGFFMIRTQNVVGPAILRTAMDLANIL